ncbi:MAG: hypothetical protein M1818_008278 [Claussenomyces sp. TS43310]|nr:MAG: hypothetical protein M1818_008278 [Claussenomyces sp. TS43310]
MSAIDLPILQAAGDLTPLDSPDGANLDLEQPPICHEYSDSHFTFARLYPAGENLAEASSNNDGDSDTSDDGGVPLGMSSPHAAGLNAEMDLLDAEVMGPYNLAAIATTSTLNAVLNDMDDEGQQAHLDTDDEMLETQQLAWFANSIQDEDNGYPHSSMTLADNPTAMSEMSTQLQFIQDGQAHGNLAVSATQYGGTPANMLPEGDIAVTFTTLKTDKLKAEDQYNLSLSDFLYSWSVVGVSRCGSGNTKKRKRGPNIGYLEELRHNKPTEIRRSDLFGERCDIQGINWKKLEVPRSAGRRIRQKTYRSYVNMRPPRFHLRTLANHRIDDSQDYFRFRRMDFTQRLHYSHFQLRNLLACTSRNNVFYAGESRIFHTNPLFGQKAVKMDLTDPVVQPTQSLQSAGWSGIMISTVAADHNLLMAGGFGGEYGMMSLETEVGDHSEGLVTDQANSITNHIEIDLSRHSGLPQAAFSSNDNGLRILDCATEKFISSQQFDYAINCTAVSPDYRLRVAVGDSRDVLILNSDTGEVLQALDGHEDYGFACAWADNGWHVATGNQDKLVKVWDARMWTDKYGHGRPLHTISSSMAGVRSLKYSPLGSGKRVLVAAEQADVVNVIDAETYSTKQTLDFYGEILGAAFTPDGQDLFVGIHDSLRGGLLEFERCGHGDFYGQRRVHFDSRRGVYDNASDDEDDFNGMTGGFDWKRTVDEVVSHPKTKGTLTSYRRKAGHLGDMDPF